MIRFYTACAAMALTACLATPAAAQIAGTYDGTAADGSEVKFVVGTDAGTGSLAVTGTTVFFTAPCKNSTYVLNTGWGFGLNADITNHKVTSVTQSNYFNITFSLKFAANGQTATGTVVSTSPAFDNSAGPAKKALFCESPKQTLSVSYTGPAARPASQHPVALVYDRKGRPIGQIQR